MREGAAERPAVAYLRVGDGLRRLRDELDADFATLLGVSGQSVYKWEHGEARPRARQLEAIAELRGIGKREAAARLEKLQG